MVLVLAIAGLILAMVFIALPALQRSQRDVQRKNDVALVKTALENYKSNNMGKYPWHDVPMESSYVSMPSATIESFIDNYLSKDGDFKSPGGGKYSVWGTVFGTSKSGMSHSVHYYNVIQIFANAKCDSSQPLGVAKLSSKESNKNRYVVFAYQESGSYYCLDGS